jgi:hypothetical protein
MSQSASVLIAATPAAVFERYRAVSRWPEWDPELLAIHVPDGLTVGATGWLKPKGGPKSAIRIVAVEPDRSFSVECGLPLCRMRFDHRLEAGAGGTLATHGLVFNGPLAWLFRLLIGRSIVATLPTTLEGLKRACEGSPAGR